MAENEDEQVRQVLDQVFSGEGQTYEQFMNGFLFLRQEDVRGPPSDEGDSLESIDGGVNGRVGPAGIVNGINGHDHSDDDDDNQGLDLDSRQGRCSQSEESLPEENLGPGSHAPSILMRTSETTGGTVVQLDNFVDDEGSPLSDLSPEDSEDDEDPSYVFSGHFSESPSQTGTELHLSPLPSQTITDSNPMERDDSEPLTQTGEDEMSTQVNTEEGGAKTRELEDKDVKPLPGEVDDDVQDGASSPGSTNVRHLGIKTTFRQCLDEQTEHTRPEDKETEYCEVEPFSIDEEFDYDNVVLTPKFNFLNSTMGAHNK